jgi:AGZA family xanthine/uracil permease-like MFS transporter
MIGIVFTAVLMVKKVRGNILWGIFFTWILAILCELTGLYVPNPEMHMYSVIPNLSAGAAAFMPASIMPLFSAISTSVVSLASTSWSSCLPSCSSISSIP